MIGVRLATRRIEIQRTIDIVRRLQHFQHQFQYAVMISHRYAMLYYAVPLINLQRRVYLINKHVRGEESNRACEVN